MKPFLDESVVDEIMFCFGRKCFWMKVFLDEFFSHLDESAPNRGSYLVDSKSKPGTHVFMMPLDTALNCADRGLRIVTSSGFAPNKKTPTGENGRTESPEVLLRVW